MTYNITLTANHQSLTAEYLPLAAESVQYLTAKVVCETEDWTGREIKAMFEQGCTVYKVPVTGGEITAKQQLNLTAGDWRVWLVGNSARDGDVIPRITTNIAHISVAPTGGTEGNPFPTIPPTVEEQLRADMGDLADLTTEDKSSLVAAINEARQTGGGGVQPDWNQNDETAPDYVKNRPFYTGNPVETVVVEESTVSFTGHGGIYAALFPSTFEATVGETYKVYWDGAVYECTCVNFDNTPVIGNLSIVGLGSDTGEPFLMIISNGEKIEIGTADTSASHTFSISGFVQEVVKIDEKYLPDTIATKSEVEATQTTAENAQTAANAAQTTANAAQTAAENAQSTANAAKTAANAAKTTANAAQTAAENAQSTANTAKTEVAKALTVNSSGSISAPIGAMNDGAYQSLTLRSKDHHHNASFKVTKSVGLQIWVDRDYGVQSSTSNPSTVEFKANGALRMRLKGIDELIMNSSTANSTKKFKITVDDNGVPTITDESDSTNTWKPTNLPTVTSSDSGKFLRVSDTGEWVAETILSASGVSF